MVLDCLPIDVIDYYNRDIVTVEVFESADNILTEAFSQENFENPGHDHEIECSHVICVNDGTASLHLF